MNRRILRLALPNILSNITVPLLGIADVTLAAHLESVSALAGIAIATNIFNMLYWGFAFLRMGTTGLTAQALGAARHEESGRLLVQSLLLGSIAGIVLLLLRTPLLQGAVWILSPSPEVTTYATHYFSIVIWAAPAVLMSYALNGWLIGMQNTLWPMIVSVGANVINISLSAYFVLVQGLDIQGIALGTLIAHYLSVVALALGAYLLYFRSRKAKLPSHASMLLEGLPRFASTNVYIVMRTMLLILITLYMTYAATQMGAMTLATNTLLLQFFTLFSYFTDGFAYAGEALVGRAYGAKDRTLLRTTIRYLLYWGTAVAVAATLLYLLLAPKALTWLTDKDELITATQPYLVWIYLVPLAGFVAFLYDGIMIGITATKEMFVSMLAAVLLFFMVWYGGGADNNHLLWLAFILYLLLRGVIQILLMRRMRGVGIPFVYTYLISVGSTITDPNHLEKVRTHLLQEWAEAELLPFTYNKDTTGRTDHTYANSILRLTTTETASELAQQCKEIENKLGRERAPHSSEVALDLDVVTCDDTVLRPKDYHAPYFAPLLNQFRSGAKKSI